MRLTAVGFCGRVPYVTFIQDSTHECTMEGWQKTFHKKRDTLRLLYICLWGRVPLLAIKFVYASNSIFFGWERAEWSDFIRIGKRETASFI